MTSQTKKPLYDYAAADRRIVTEAATKFTEYGEDVFADVLEALHVAAKKGYVSPDAAKIAIDDATAVAVASARVADKLREIAAAMPVSDDDAAKALPAGGEMGVAA